MFRKKKQTRQCLLCTIAQGIKFIIKFDNQHGTIMMTSSKQSWYLISVEQQASSNHVKPIDSTVDSKTFDIDLVGTGRCIIVVHYCSNNPCYIIFIIVSIGNPLGPNLSAYVLSLLRDSMFKFKKRCCLLIVSVLFQVLESFKIMDYSLLLGIHILDHKPLSRGSRCDSRKGQKVLYSTALESIQGSMKDPEPLGDDDT